MKFSDYVSTHNSFYGLDFKSDEALFQRMLNFIISLDPEQLSDNQLEEVSSMLEDLEVGDEDITEVRLAKRTAAEKRRYQRTYYRRYKSKILRKRKKFRRSAEGRKRKKLKKRYAKIGKTPTGRRKVRYHR